MSKKLRKTSLWRRLKKQPYIAILIAVYSVAWSWLLFTDSLDLAGSKLQGVILAIFVLLINVFLSVVVVVKSVDYINNLTNKLHPVVNIMVILPLFAVMDFMVSWLIAIIWIGPGGSVDNVLPLSSPSLLLVNTPFGYASRLIGFYGLTAFGWTVVYVFFNKRLRRFLWLPICALTILALIGYLVYKTPNGGEFKATIISEELDNRIGIIESGSTDLVIFPEYGLDIKEESTLVQDRIKIDKSSALTYFLGSKQIIPNDFVGHYNELLYGNSSQGLTAKQNKYRLIPGGEDLPYAFRILLRATNQKSTLDYFSYAKMVLKGNQQLKPFDIGNDTKVGAAVCSSIISPQDYREFANDKASIFSNSASLTIFKGSPVFAFQQKTLARFMAVANSRYFLQSANAASAYVLDNNGKQITEIRGIKSKTVKVRNNHTVTIYTHIGEFLLIIGLLMISFNLFRYLFKQNKFVINKRSKNKA